MYSYLTITNTHARIRASSILGFEKKGNFDGYERLLWEFQNISFNLSSLHLPNFLSIVWGIAVNRVAIYCCSFLVLCNCWEWRCLFPLCNAVYTFDIRFILICSFALMLAASLFSFLGTIFFLLHFLALNWKSILFKSLYKLKWRICGY